MRAEWKKILIAGVFATSLCSYAADDKAVETANPPKAATAEEGHITQGEFARMLAVQLGLFPALTASPSEQECAAALVLQGVSPFDGWKLATKLSKADFARMMIQAMGKAGEIPEGSDNDPKAWIALAGKLGIVLEHATTGVGAADPLVEQFVSDDSAETSNPLQRRQLIGQPDELHAGAGQSFEASFGPVAADIVAPAVSNLRPPGNRPRPPPPPPPTTRG